MHTQNTQNHITGNDLVQIEFKSFYNIQENHAYTKYVGYQSTGQTEGQTDGHCAVT